MSFGWDDAKSSYEHHKGKKQAEMQEVYKKEILYCWKPKLIEIICMEFA